MRKIIAIHSFRNGTGKSEMAANISALLAAEGLRIGLIDGNLQTPALHSYFGLSAQEIALSFNDVLLGKCTLREAVYDVTARLDTAHQEESGNPDVDLAEVQTPISGRVFVIPASDDPAQKAAALNEGLDAKSLSESFRELIAVLRLDALFIDTSAGLRPETLPLIAVSHGVAVLLRLDPQDFQGTGVAVDVMRKLEIPHIVLVINRVAHTFDFTQVKSQVEQAYKCEVAGVLPQTDEMAAQAQQGIFVLRYPNHPLTARLRYVSERLVK